MPVTTVQRQSLKLRGRKGRCVGIGNANLSERRLCGRLQCRLSSAEFNEDECRTQLARWQSDDCRETGDRRDSGALVPAVTSGNATFGEADSNWLTLRGSARSRF